MKQRHRRSIARPGWRLTAYVPAGECLFCIAKAIAHNGPVMLRHLRRRACA